MSSRKFRRPGLNIATGDFSDAFGLPIAADTGMGTLFAGLAVAVVGHAISEITADFSGLF
jgi:hypothetical protein